MTERLVVRAYWKARKESADGCAERTAKFLDDVREVDRLFSIWYLKSTSRKKATQQPLIIDREILTRLIAAGVNRRDDNKAPIPDLGFNFGAWAGRADGVAAGFHVTCGSYNKYVENVCVIDVTEGHSLGSDHVERIVSAAVRAWDPDVVDVNSTPVYCRSR